MIAHLAMNAALPLAVAEFRESLRAGERSGGKAARSSAAVLGSRFREFRSPGKISQARCSKEAEQGRDQRHPLFRRLAQQSLQVSAHKTSSGHNHRLNCFKKWDLGSRTWCAGVHGPNVGVPSYEEPRPGEQKVGEFGENSVARFQILNNIPEDVVSHAGGKAGSISFYTPRSSSAPPEPVKPVPSPGSRSELLPSLIWLLGPLTLVASVVLPPLYLRRIFGAVLEDSLVTDFVILFFTETLFFVGASIFLYIAHLSRLATESALEQQKLAHPSYAVGYRISAKITLAIGVVLPVVSFVLVWPWTGPAAAAALAPYMVGLLVQLGFEYIIRAKDSPVWPLVPITFQMYRLHQLNRAAQLVAGLLFSLKGVEATAETMAINGSLQTLLFVLQVLGMLCLWSLGSFLTNQLPTRLGQQSTPSLP